MVNVVVHKLGMTDLKDLDLMQQAKCRQAEACGIEFTVEQIAEGWRWRTSGEPQLLDFHHYHSMPLTVVAMGTQEVDGYPRYVHMVEQQFPSIRNCCVDVSSVLCEQHLKQLDSHGMDNKIRKELKEQHNWRIAYEVAVAILHSFDLVIILCRSGRYISLALATDIAEEFNASLYCHHGVANPSDTYLKPNVVSDPFELLSKLYARLDLHKREFEKHSYPVLGVVAPSNDREKVEMGNANYTHLNAEELEKLKRSGIRVRDHLSECETAVLVCSELNEESNAFLKEVEALRATNSACAPRTEWTVLYLHYSYATVIFKSSEIEHEAILRGAWIPKQGVSVCETLTSLWNHGWMSLCGENSTGVSGERDSNAPWKSRRVLCKGRNAEHKSSSSGQ